jgi:cyclase
VESVVQENTKTNMTKMDEFKGDKARFLPNKTYKDKLTLGSGKDQIDLYHFGPGHTNGDTFVVFTAARTMHTGDMFAWKALPYIDPDNGGSVVEHPKTLTRVLDGVKNVDTVIMGHIPVGTWNDLREFRDFNADFVAYAERSLKAGKSVEQAVKEYTVPPRFKGYVASENPAFGGPKPNLEIAYKELR